MEPPWAPIPPKVAPPGEAWEGVSLQRGVDFDSFARIKKRDGLYALTGKIPGSEAPLAAPPYIKL